ncbi:MAG: hypothetical protein QNJ98_01995 [Planctomycetota bacterium]|nr:hypothetical protein [Planctomycetota bacterium]
MTKPLDHIPSDLEPEERGVANWFADLPRPDADPELMDRVRAALPEADPAPAAPSLAEPEEVRRMWGWWTAAAAILLLALGVQALRGDEAAPLRQQAEPQAAAPIALTRPEAQRNLWVMEDPNLALFHDLETFDYLGLGPTDVLALGDR